MEEHSFPLYQFSIRHDFHFPGHLLPGTAFIIMGIWWMWNAFKINAENDQQRENSEYKTLLSENKDDDVRNSPFLATYNGNGSSIFYCEGFYKVSHLCIVLHFCV